MIGEVFVFKNGVYIHDYSDFHAGSFIFNSFSLTRGNEIDFDFDFEPTLKIDNVQRNLGHNFLYNCRADSWEHLRNCLHRALCNDCTKESAYFDINYIGYDNYNILCNRGIVRLTNRGRGANNNFNRVSPVLGGNIEFCNLLMPRYLRVINGGNTYMVNYLPYLKCDSNHDLFLNDLTSAKK